MNEAIRALNIALRGGDEPRTDAEWRAKAIQLMNVGESVLEAWIDHVENHCVSFDAHKASQLRALDAVEAASERIKALEAEVLRLKQKNPTPCLTGND